MFDFLKYLDVKLVPVITQLENDIKYKSGNIMITIQTFCELMLKLVEFKETGIKVKRKALGKYLEDEKFTNILLNECKIVSNREKKFDWLRNDRTNFVLPLDFYLPDYNIAVECQGGQHFLPTEGFGGKEEFENVKYRDLIKNKLCKENDVRLIYITNKKFKRYLNQKQFNGIYDNNVYFIEDLLENNIHLIDIFDENIQNI